MEWMSKKDEWWHGTGHRFSSEISGKETDSEGYESSVKKQCGSWIQNYYASVIMKATTKMGGWNYQARNLEQTKLVNLCMMYNYTVELMNAKCCRQ